MLLAHATEPPPSFAEAGGAEWVSAEVERVVLRCLEKDPADRPQSTVEYAERIAASVR